MKFIGYSIEKRIGFRIRIGLMTRTLLVGQLYSKCYLMNYFYEFLENVAEQLIHLLVVCIVRGNKSSPPSWSDTFSSLKPHLSGQRWNWWSALQNFTEQNLVQGLKFFDFQWAWNGYSCKIAKTCHSWRSHITTKTRFYIQFDSV